MPAAPSSPSLTVTGHGRVSVPADRVVFTIKLEALAPTAGETEQSLESRRQRLLACLAQAEAPRRRIRSSGIQLHPEHTYEKSRWIYQGIRASETITVRVPFSPARASRILHTLAAELEHLRVSVDYLARDTAAARAEALRLAVADAREQAAIIAEASGLALDSISTIKHHREATRDHQTTYNTIAEADPAGGIDPASTIVKAQVETVWNISPRVAAA